MCAAVARAHEVIRIDAAWFAVEPIDMRAGVDKALARVVDVFGEARAHHAYLFINKRANRMKVLVHDGFGLWLCARKLVRPANAPDQQKSDSNTSTGSLHPSSVQTLCCAAKRTATIAKSVARPTNATVQIDGSAL